MNTGTVRDFTSSIELKTSETSPMLFEQENFEDKDDIPVLEKEPDLSSKDGAIGQALMYTLDTLHCLARRGISVDKLPITVLACMKTTTTKLDRLLCVDAWLHIPEYTGDEFFYTVNCPLPFPSAGAEDIRNQSTEEDEDEDKDKIYKRAIAFYIRVLRVGVQYGKNIVETTNPSPISLCCRKLKIGDNKFGAADVELLASPIPDAPKCVDTLGKVYGFEISQGELFKFVGSVLQSKPVQLSEFGKKKNMYYFAAKGTTLSDKINVIHVRFLAYQVVFET